MTFFTADSFKSSLQELKSRPIQQLFALVFSFGPYLLFNLKTQSAYFHFLASGLLGSLFLIPNFGGRHWIHFMPFGILASLFTYLQLANNRFQNFQVILVVLLLSVLLNAKNDNSALMAATFRRWISLASAAVVALFVGSLGAGIVYSIQSLFGIDLSNWFISLPFLLALFLFIEAHMLFLLSTNDEQTYKPLSYLARLLFVFMLVYSLVLLLYKLKILIGQEAPQGFASIPASIALILWFITSVLKDEAPESSSGRRLFQLLPLIALPLLIYGFFKRITEYGFTPERVYLGIWTVWILTIGLIFLVKKASLRRSIFIALSLLTFSLIPYFDVLHVSARSQLARLKAQLEGTETLSPESRVNIISMLATIKKVYTAQEIESLLKKSLPDKNPEELKKILNEDQGLLTSHKISRPGKCWSFETRNANFFLPKLSQMQTFDSTYFQESRIGKTEIYYQFKINTLIINGKKSQTYKLNELMWLKDKPVHLKVKFEGQNLQFTFLNAYFCEKYSNYSGVVFFD